jgi:ABC-type antimicrobial peptide transport system permease subunit
VGVYGVVAYAAARRTCEIGIRIALGARRADVTRSMLGQSAVFIGLGVVLGLAGSALATPWLGGLLFGLGPLDARTFVSVTIALAGIAALASYLPARRAGGSVDRDSLRVAIPTISREFHVSCPSLVAENAQVRP